ncbi:MAG TPA: hypothetical protein PL009_01260 [Flavipsychrobacter sp.]|nr:hypothetical protein [Flavipsychrobacter sp.]
MNTQLFTPALCFMMKYFFDVEKEITQTLLMSAKVRISECKGVASNIYSHIATHR